MELNFLCWLYASLVFLCSMSLTNKITRMCLEHIGILKKDDDAAVVTRVFWR